MKTTQETFTSKVNVGDKAFNCMKCMGQGTLEIKYSLTWPNKNGIFHVECTECKLKLDIQWTKKTEDICPDCGEVYSLFGEDHNC